jgi:hypothetical protein
MMSLNGRALRLPRYALEPDRLQRVLNAAPRAQVDIIREITREMNHTATQSVLETLRSDKESKHDESASVDEN